MNALVVYYSWSNGNTERIAEMLGDAIGADTVRIDTALPYEGSYDDVVEQGRREVEEGFEPELKPIIADVSDYDVVAIGTPTWWYTMAPAVLSFVRSHDWNGKTVIPFMTDGGWPGHVIDDMAGSCAGADIVEPMEIRFDSEGGSDMVTPMEDVEAWISRVKVMLEGM